MTKQATQSLKRSLARDFAPIDQERALLIEILRRDVGLMASYLSEGGPGSISRPLYKNCLHECRRRIHELENLELTAAKISGKKAA